MVVLLIAYVTLLVTGLMAGIHFFNLIGGGPALARLERAHTFIAWWQSVDHFMAARMRLFGPLVLVLQLATVVLLLSHGAWLAAAFYMIVFTLTVFDAVVAVTGNMPLNQLVQSWQPEGAPPPDWREIRAAMLRHFQRRGALSIAAFALALAGTAAVP